MKRVFAKALFVGRFQPFHLGHLHAIKKAVERHGSIVIAIGSANRRRERKNPFSGRERREMIEAVLKKIASLRGKWKIILLDDFESDVRWVEELLKKARFQVVVTGSKWVRKCLEKKFSVEGPAFFRRRELRATKIRDLIRREKGPWKRLVPGEVGWLILKTKQ